MSIRTVLVAGMLAVALIPAVVIGAIGVSSISHAVRSEAQSRVNHDLDIVVSGYHELRIALSNYLTNAAKYGREGGRVRVTVRAQDDHLTLSVWNEGEGFPAEEAERLFEKFYRLRNENTHAKRGSGLGLFTVKTIVALHGGRAWAESEPGEWAAFHLAFPE